MAAATSTGGMTNKKFGRIGDTPIIGSGTYANNKTCAISCTGHGEYFIRAVVGGDGGLIGIDYQGNVCLSFNTEGMYRAFKKSNGDHFVGIYK